MELIFAEIAPHPNQPLIMVIVWALKSKEHFNLDDVQKLKKQ